VDQVFERSQFKNEAGAAVSIPPNGGRVLAHWGFDVEKAGGIDNMQVRRPKGDTLEAMAPTLSFADVKEKFGERWLFYHRVDMHRTLREMAEGHGAVIHLGSKVTDVDVDQGVVIVDGGAKYQKDLVVVADGQHDQINVKVTGTEVPMQRSGQTAYRCLIPMESIMEDEETRHLFENQPPGFWAPALPAKGVMVVTYPCRDNKILNVLAVCRSLATHGTSEEEIIKDWNYPATHVDLEKVLDGFHPHVKKAFLKAPEVKVYTQMKRQPLSKMTKGKTVLIGDACHPMLLTHAQGVSSSIEDAAALELFLDNLPASPSVDSAPSEALLQRLQQFEKFRLGRVSATQILTEPVIPGPQAMENYKKQEALIRQYYDGPLPPTGSAPHSPGICQFFFGYDVRKEAIEFMQSSPPSAISETKQPIKAASPKVSPTASHTPNFSRQAPLVHQQTAPAAPDNAEVEKAVREAQTALTAAQTSLEQATQTLVAAQKALNLAVKSMGSTQQQPPASSPAKTSPAPANAPAQQQAQQPAAGPATTVSSVSSANPEPVPSKTRGRPVSAMPVPPTPSDKNGADTKPKKRKSLSALRSKIGSLVSVKEVSHTPPETPQKDKNSSLTNGNASSAKA
jgi:salicylate hydroxylase